MCAQELGRRDCDFIIHSGVPLVVSQKAGFEKDLIAKISAIAGLPATTSIQAAMEALQYFFHGEGWDRKSLSSSAQSSAEKLSYCVWF